MNGFSDNPSKPDRNATRFLLSPVVFLALRLFFGGLFLYSGALKLADTAGFSQTIAAYRILPDPLVPCAAMGLPAIEVLVGLGTLLNRRLAMLCMLGLMILFLGVLSYGVAIGLDIDCGCFSAGENPAQAAQPLPLPGIGLPGEENLDSTIVTIEPAPGMEEEAETCTGDGGDPTRLRKALIRDFFLFLGVLYMVAWPDLRRKFRLKPNGPRTKG